MYIVVKKKIYLIDLVYNQQIFYVLLIVVYMMEMIKINCIIIIFIQNFFFSLCMYVV